MSRSKNPGGDPDPDDIGAQLKRRRTLRGQSLEAIHQQTRIPRESLEALEANRFDHFPAPVYMRGFLRSYCEYLDVDYEPLLEALEEADPDAKSEGRHPTPRARRLETPFWLPLSESTLLPFILIIGLAIAGGLLWALKGRPDPDASREKRPPPPAQQRSAKQITVVLEALRTATVVLEARGEVVFEGRLHPSQTPAFTGRAFVLKTSTPQDLRVLVDGRERPWSTLPPASKGVYPIEPDGL